MVGVRISRVAVAVLALVRVGLVQVFADVPDDRQAVPISNLVEQSYAFDGQTVTIEGEVIGDIMKRGTHVWVTILDNGVAVGVWADGASLYAEPTAGGYELDGDRVRVTGVMHRACGEHGGDFDVHLENIALLAKGHHTEHPIAWARKLAATLLCGSSLAFSVLYGRRKRSAVTT